MTEPTVSASKDYRAHTRFENIGRALGARVHDGPVRRVLRSAYHAWLNLRAGGKGLPAHLPGGEVVRILPEYRYVTWNPAEYEAFRAALKPGDTVLDVGANVGCYSVLFAQWVGHAGRVYAFEPDSAACAGLTRHLALTAVRVVCAAVPMAVAEHAQGEILFQPGEHGDGRLAVDQSLAGNGRVVACTSIDAFCSERGLQPALIKIDVEGAELAVLRGARETIARGRGRLALFMEIHPDIWPSIGSSRAELEAELSAQGLRAEALVPRADPWSVVGECLRLEWV